MRYQRHSATLDVPGSASAHPGKARLSCRIRMETSMRPAHSRPSRLLLLLAGLLTLLAISLSWRGPVAADPPHPTATPIATPAEGAAADTDPFPVTDTMTDTMQLALDAYL